MPKAPRLTQILLVDDEDLVRNTTYPQLREVGYSVSEANSAAAALRLVDKVGRRRIEARSTGDR